VVGRQAVADKLSLSIRERQGVLVVDDSIPKDGDVAELLHGRQLIETGRWIGNSVRHT
jgi:hypothetical protein